jgi:hypothetical protein
MGDVVCVSNVVGLKGEREVRTILTGQGNATRRRRGVDEIPDAIALGVALVGLTVVFVRLRRAYKRNQPRDNGEPC